jgi:hypothetical protein
VRRRGVLLEGLLFSFSLLAGPLTALFLALAAYARFAALLSAASLVLTGYLLCRLAKRRLHKSDLTDLLAEIEKERRAGRLCMAIGATLAALALALAPWIAVLAGLLGTGFAGLRAFSMIGDTANREADLEIGNLSPADECPHIGIWGRRISALPGSAPERLGSAVDDVPAPGKIRGARLITLALAAGALLAYAGTAVGLVYKEVRSPHRDQGSKYANHDSGEEPSDHKGDGDLSPLPLPTYEDECPDLADPLAIGHGLGRLFRIDGAFKAGCGTEAEQVLGTGAWFSRGICTGRLRSFAVTDSRGDGAILYGAAARFALRAAQRGELVSAEEAAPAGGDVYVVETLSGSYGFARQAATSGSSGEEVRDCTEVTGTDRPFAELDPPMLLHWRDLVQLRAAWSWPVREDIPGDSLAFASYPDGEIVAHGGCTSEFSCYLEVDGDIWPGNETSYVSLDEFKPYIPPSPQ